MACPNCNHEDVEYDDEMIMRWELLSSFLWRRGAKEGCERIVICAIDYCPFCGEQLLSPSEACSRGCDG